MKQDQIWLTLLNSNGNAGDSLIVTIDIDGLSAGKYESLVQIHAPGALNSPLNIIVNLIIRAKAKDDGYIHRVNCGSWKNYLDVQGNLWSADQYYVNGSWGFVGGRIYATDDEIDNTADDALFQTERWGMGEYRFDLDDGLYRINLLFAEIYFYDPGKRKFHVEIENERALSNYDIYAEVGHDFAVVKTYQVSVIDQQLNIQFTKVIEDLKISAIQIMRINDCSSSMPQDYKFVQNYPNPFRESTTIAFALASTANIELEVYNLLGQRIHNKTLGHFSEGQQEITLFGEDKAGELLPSGVYIYQVKVKNSTYSRILRNKMILTR